VFCRGFEAPRAPAQVDDPWFLGLVVTGRVFLVAGGANVAFFPWGVVCVRFCTRVWVLLDSCTIFFYLNEMTRSSPV
jgi:hypothetical protein